MKVSDVTYLVYSGRTRGGSRRAKKANKEHVSCRGRIGEGRQRTQRVREGAYLKVGNLLTTESLRHSVCEWWAACELAVEDEEAGAIAADECSEDCLITYLRRGQKASLIYMSGACYRD